MGENKMIIWTELETSEQKINIMINKNKLNSLARNYK